MFRCIAGHPDDHGLPLKRIGKEICITLVSKTIKIIGNF